MTKYQYKIVVFEREVKKDGSEGNFIIPKFPPQEWRFVTKLFDNALLFEKVIQEPEYTFTVPNSTGTYTQPQPDTNNPVILN